MNKTFTPELAPPGAGLPMPELLVARLLFGFRSRSGSRAAFNAKFNQERAAIRRIVQQLDPSRAGRRVLIPRVRGLEDSSRFWSVWMTLDHLRIVNSAIADVIGMLARDKTPPREASTAAVKPSPEVTEAVVSAHERACDHLLDVIESVKDLNTRLRYAHPWFGPLNASQWHALSAGHMEIHRKQIERIQRGLDSTS